MRNLTTAIAFLCIVCSLTSCAQGKYGVKKIQAFTKERMPGNIPVQIEGVPVHTGPDTLLIIYVETKGTTVAWDSVWWNNKTWRISAVAADQTTVEVGTEKNNGKGIVINAEPGSQLWILYTEEVKSGTEPPQKMGKNEILLGGVFKGKRVTRLIGSFKELESIPSV